MADRTGVTFAQDGSPANTCTEWIGTENRYTAYANVPGVNDLSCLENQGFDSSLLSIRGMFLTSGDAEIEVHEISLNSAFNGRNTIEYCR